MPPNRRIRATVAVLLTLLAALTGCAAESADTTAVDEVDEPAPVTPADDSTTSPASDPPADDPHEDMEGMEGMEDDDHEDVEETYHFGAPAEAAEADRTITIEATDEMAFDPATVEVSAGEVITFEVVNVGQLPHDFTLGDEEAQQQHEAEMAEMDEEMAHAELNSMTVDAGQTATLTWQFTEGGEVLYGCHQLGHYDSGMVGSVEVS